MGHVVHQNYSVPSGASTLLKGGCKGSTVGVTIAQTYWCFDSTLSAATTFKCSLYTLSVEMTLV